MKAIEAKERSSSHSTKRERSESQRVKQRRGNSIMRTTIDRFIGEDTRRGGSAGAGSLVK